MGDGGQIRPGFRPYALGRGVGRDQVGEGLLDGLEAAEEGVILTVRDLGAGLYVIEVVVTLDAAPKMGELGLGLGLGQGLGGSGKARLVSGQCHLLDAEGMEDRTINGIHPDLK
jgi:hypothetical protein